MYMIIARESLLQERSERTFPTRFKRKKIMFTYIPLLTHICMYAYVDSGFIYVYVYIFIYTHMCVHIYIYIYTYVCVRVSTY